MSHSSTPYEFKTKTVESSKIGDLFNELETLHGPHWALFHTSTINDGYITFVTYRVNKPKDRTPARPEE